ncbi:MAG TPA: TIGR03067 domain-containing protein [Gemmataceae bacterium]|nr:TIGR03067 domain-containing protein [Gemmataceae bacterium]
MRFGILLCAVSFLLAADNAKNDVNQKDLERLQGDWAAVSIISNGNKLGDDDVQSLFRTTKGDQYTVFLFRKPIGKGTIKIDATKQPKTIDFLPASVAAVKPKPLLGIYEFDGDTWKVCYALPGRERPTEFTSKEESGQTLAVWEREKK